MNSLPPQDTAISALKWRISNRLARQFMATPLSLANRQPIVSFTFDDIPDSAANYAAPLIEDHGARATFYVAGGLTGRNAGYWDCATADQIATLHRHGHEIACHTFSHHRITDISRSAMTRDFEANWRFLRTLDPSIQPTSFAYPYGVASVVLKPDVRKLFRSARSVLPGINVGRVDCHYLRAYPLVSVLSDATGIDHIFDEVVKTNGWLIFYGHDVAERPSDYGCTPDLLRHAVKAATRRNVVMKTMAEALAEAASSSGRA